MTSITGVATDFIQFTRASNATVTDSDGKVKWAPHNLLTNSESFDSSNWTKTGFSSVSANSISAPNGTTTADLLTENSLAGVERRMNQAGTTVSAGASYTVAVIAKTNGRLLQINFGGSEVTGDPRANYDLSSGVLGTVDAGITATISSLGNSWYLCAATVTAATTTLTTMFSLITTSTAARRETYTGDGVKGLYFWGAHLYRSDLGGMQANTSAYPMYNPTTPKNLLGYTEDFSDSYWTKGSVLAFGSGSVANATLSPNGLQTADLVVPSTSSGYQNIRRSYTIASPHTISIYAKAAGYTNLRISDFANGSIYASFNLSTGVVIAGTTGGTAFSSAAIVAVGDGWYRCSVTTNTTTSTAYTFTFSGYPTGATIDNYGATFAGNGTSGVYIWGAQLSDSASLDTYSPVYGAAVTSAAYYGPRRDFDPVTLACKGLLVEEQRTNLAIYSSDFSNAAWNSGSLRTLQVTTDQTTAPDGTNTADKVVEAAAGAGSVIQRLIQIEATASAQKVFSVYAKKAERKRIYLFVNGPDDGGWFDLDLGTSGAATDWPGGVTSITPVGNGWYRCSLIPGTASTGQFQIAVISNTATTFDTRVGDGTSGVYLWGAQLEAGSFATSYIPVGATTAGATRNADVASVSTQAFPYSATEGTVVVNATTISTSVAANRYIGLNLAASPISNRLLDLQRSGATYANYKTSDAQQTSFGTWQESSKIGAVYKADDYAFVANGGTIVSDTSTSGLATADTLAIGQLNSGSQLNGHIRQITYLPRRISNTELQTRTA